LGKNKLGILSMYNESYLKFAHYDLVTPDGKIESIQFHANSHADCRVIIEHISSAFVGFNLDQDHIYFNLKSTLAQLGLHSEKKNCEIDKKNARAVVDLKLIPFGPIAVKMLSLLKEGAYIGKLFAADPSRRVRNPDYLLRMFGRSDRFGKPLLSLGGLHGSDELLLEKVEGRTVAFLTLLKGTVSYDQGIYGLLDTFAKALHFPQMKIRNFLSLHQVFNENDPRYAKKDDILLVKTVPLHIRTVFGKVVDSLLPSGLKHTSASILEPDTRASGDIYELFGNSSKELEDVPLEFFTLEPHREYVFFSDRDQLQTCLENPQTLFKAFETAPKPKHHGSAVFIFKGDQLLNLKEQDWITKEPHLHEFPGLLNPTRQALMAERYIQEQPSYPFLKAIEDGHITSQGILLTRYFPSPLMKKMLLSNQVMRNLKGIYFQYPSRSYGDYFSHEDRSMLLDLAKFGIPVYWLDSNSNKMLQYVPKPNKDAGMFVPLDQVEAFIKATAFGIYGSNLIESTFEAELEKLFLGLKELSQSVDHPLLNKSIPIALITGGGPGVMEVGNRVAKKVGVLSCANIVDFSGRSSKVVHEQKTNPYIDAKMTYRLDRLVERQAEFNLDFPIFLHGGIGTDFEYCLEEVRRKIGSSQATPVLLFGSHEYWSDKITSRFRRNLKEGTITGSEWVSNCFFCVQDAKGALKVYKHYFEGSLRIGKGEPFYDDGFVTIN
jgi:predicted Rossmann-fold nucleotide-binding protein